MKPYDINTLKDAAHRILFDMSDEQYETLLKEFDVVTSQMKLIGQNFDESKYEPMVFPFECTTSYLREDVPATPLSRDEALRNAQNKTGGQIKLPKVVL